jgi:hypothetical protein
VQEIFIDVDTKGNVTIEGKNIAGADCKKLTEGIEQELGEVTAFKKKPEFHQARVATRTTGH